MTDERALNSVSEERGEERRERRREEEKTTIGKVKKDVGISANCESVPFIVQ